MGNDRGPAAGGQLSIATGAGLTGVGMPARILLILTGLSTLGIAATPEPPTGPMSRHLAFAVSCVGHDSGLAGTCCQARACAIVDPGCLRLRDGQPRGSLSQFIENPNKAEDVIYVRCELADDVEPTEELAERLASKMEFSTGIPFSIEFVDSIPRPQGKTIRVVTE